MLGFSIPDVPNGDWPLMLFALNGGILAFLALWGLLAACAGTRTDEKEATEEVSIPTATPPQMVSTPVEADEVPGRAERRHRTAAASVIFSSVSRPVPPK
jgi:hypothetical protein